MKKYADQLSWFADDGDCHKSMRDNTDLDMP